MKNKEKKNKGIGKQQRVLLSVDIVNTLMKLLISFDSMYR